MQGYRLKKSMYQKRIRSTLLLALLTCLVACSSPAKYKQAPDPKDPAPVKGKTLVFLNPELGKILRVVDKPRAARVYDEHLEVEVALKNITAYDAIYLSIQTVYWDAEGKMLYDVPGFSPEWSQIIIPPGETVHYKNESLTHHATDFSIRIKHNMPEALSLPSMR